MKKRTLFVIVTVLFTLFSCGTQDEDGIFKDIEKEIELDDAVVKGNIFDIVSDGGKLYAGGGKVYVKENAGQRRGWKVFSDCPRSNGIVIRLAVSGGTMTVECAENTSRGYFYQTPTSKVEWKSGGSISPPAKISDVVDSDGGRHSVTCSAAGLDGAMYYGTSRGAYSLKGGKWEILPGENTKAAIGNYRISAIYASGNAVYVGTIGTGTTYGTKNNGLWAYYSSNNEWNRE
jgi:hypothetical protein